MNDLGVADDGVASFPPYFRAHCQQQPQAQRSLVGAECQDAKDDLRFVAHRKGDPQLCFGFRISEICSFLDSR